MKDQKIKGTHSSEGLKTEKSAIYGMMWRKILRSTSARPSGKIVHYIPIFIPLYNFIFFLYSFAQIFWRGSAVIT